MGILFSASSLKYPAYPGPCTPSNQKSNGVIDILNWIWSCLYLVPVFSIHKHSLSILGLSSALLSAQDQYSGMELTGDISRRVLQESHTLLASQPETGGGDERAFYTTKWVEKESAEMKRLEHHKGKEEGGNLHIIDYGRFPNRLRRLWGLGLLWLFVELLRGM